MQSKSKFIRYLCARSYLKGGFHNFIRRCSKKITEVLMNLSAFSRYKTITHKENLKKKTTLTIKPIILRSCTNVDRLILF